jgi:hypothetical protein
VHKFAEFDLTLAFASWCLNEEVEELDLLSEIFNAIDIARHHPENGKWNHEPTDSDGAYVYSFDVPGEDCNIGPPGTVYSGRSGKEPCYTVSIGYSGGEADIEFGHTETSYDDRDNTGTNTGVEVMYSVLHAIMQFVQAVEPPKLTWSASEKSRDNANNPQARKKVYFAWAVKNLFPERYVPISDQKWWSREFYDSAKEEGWPDAPEKGGSRSAKTFMAEVEEAREKERRVRDDEAMMRRQDVMDRLPFFIAHPDLNPNQLKVGDLVKLPDESVVYKINKIEPRFETYGNRDFTNTLQVTIDARTGFWLDEQRFASFVNDGYGRELIKYTPSQHSFSVGDLVRKEGGSVMKIEEIEPDGRIQVLTNLSPEGRPLGGQSTAFYYSDDLKAILGVTGNTQQPQPAAQQPPSRAEMGHPDVHRGRSSYIPPWPRTPEQERD